MWFRSLFFSAGARCRARDPARRRRRTTRQRPGTRRAAIERLEERTVLSGGLVLTPIGAGSSVGLASFLDSSGQIVVAGYVQLTTTDSDFAAVRYQASDGALDPTFGNGGVVTTPVTKYLDSAYAAVRYPAGETEKIVLAGYAEHLYGRYNYRTTDFALARYNADGTLDSTFGGQTPNIPGTVQTDLGNITDYGEGISGVVVQPVQLAGGQWDNRIVAAGKTDASGASQFALARYTSTGQLDSTFGTGGIVKTSVGGGVSAATAVTLQQGKILAVGTASNNFALVRYNSDGSLDTTFGDLVDPSNPLLGRKGTVVTDLGASDTAVGLAVDGFDQSIVVIGNHSDPVDMCHFALARYHPDGTLDTTFGTDGLAVTNLGRRGSEPRAVAIEAGSRKIVAVGRTDDGRSDFAVGRFNSDGTLDDTFGTGGAVFTPILQAARATSVVIQSDGQIVAAGYAYDGSRSHIALARYDTHGNLDPTFGPPFPPASFTITDVSVIEGNGGTVNAVFKVTRSIDPLPGVSVDYATANGTATAPGDYVAIPTTTLTFAPGEISKTIKVVVKGDTLKENNEMFFVNLTNATGGAVISDSQGIGTIVNDDGKPKSSSLSSATLAEAAMRSAAQTDYAALAAAAMAEPTAALTPSGAAQEGAAGDSGVQQRSATAADVPRPADAPTAVLGRTKQTAPLDGSQRHPSAVDLVLGDPEADLLADELAAVLVP
jgi:uncharacterized delta-60 repeat protein